VAKRRGQAARAIQTRFWRTTQPPSPRHPAGDTGYVTELWTTDDQIDERAKAKVGFHHLLDQRLVGELNAAAKGVAKELAAELAGEVIAALGEQVVAEIAEAIDGGSIGQGGLRVGLAGAADGVEGFESETVRVDAFVAAHAVLIAAVSLDELTLGEICGGFLRQEGHAFRRDGQLLAEDDLRQPSAA
jgi:hypothetical protein